MAAARQDRPALAPGRAFGPAPMAGGMRVARALAGLDGLAGWILPDRRHSPARSRVAEIARMHLAGDGDGSVASVAVAATALLRRRAVEMSDPRCRADALIVAAAALAETGRRVHVVSLSGAKSMHLAERAGDTLRRLGLAFEAVADDADLDARSQAFRKPVVFASVARLAQDWLRDQVEASRGSRGARGHVRRLGARKDQLPALLPADADALVDDADLAMLEAVRPVRFAGEADPGLGRICADQAFAILSMLVRERHYSIDPATLRIRLTAEGRERVATFAMLFGGAWADPGWREETIHAAIAIRDLFRSETDYRVENGTVILNRAVSGARVEPSIPDLVAAKEGLRSGTGLPHLSDTRRMFLGYARLGATGMGLGELRDELALAYGLRVSGRGAQATPAPPSVHRDRGALIAALAGWRGDPEHTWAWAPAPEDAADLPGDLRACRLLAGDELFAATGAPGLIVQVGAAPRSREARIAAAFPAAGHAAFVSPDDALWRIFEQRAPALERLRASPGVASYRAAQAALADASRKRRMAHLRSVKYFDRVLSFLGET